MKEGVGTINLAIKHAEFDLFTNIVTFYIDKIVNKITLEFLQWNF